jgi:hypothetical protein
MIDATKLKITQKKLTALERAIREIREQRVIAAFTSPLATEQRRLERLRAATEAELALSAE